MKNILALVGRQFEVKRPIWFSNFFEIVEIHETSFSVHLCLEEHIATMKACCYNQFVSMRLLVTSCHHVIENVENQLELNKRIIDLVFLNQLLSPL